MITKCVIVTFCLSVLQLLLGVYGYYDDVDLEDLRAVSTHNNSVRGVFAYIGEYPFSVIFYEQKPRPTKFGTFLSPICSGSIVSSRWVLTTATPLGEYPIEEHFLVAGVRKIVHSVEHVLNYTRNIYHTSLMIIHPKWHEHGYNNLGMVRVSRPFSFGKEVGTLKTPYEFVPAHSNHTICTMNIWAADFQKEHLMGHYQNADIVKQTIKFRVANGPEVCPDYIVTNKTLCVIQVESDRRKDVCSVNSGAILRCSCKFVGLFTGINGELDCVDQPPERYTAVNLVEYGDWIAMVKDTVVSDKPKTHTISSSSSRKFSLLSSLFFFHFLKQHL